MDPMMIFFIAILFGNMVYSIYWQSQITVKARFRYMPLMISVLILFWIVATPQLDFGVVIVLAEFVTLNVMDGVGGIGSKKLVTSGFFSQVVDYARIAKLQITPLVLPNGKPRTVVVFQTHNQRQFQLNFSQSAEDLIRLLKGLLPQGVEIEVNQLF